MQLGDHPPDARRRRAAARCASSVISAWWVTSRPIIVVSMPLAKTRFAASGSAQMLNSAAGVRLPSPIEPPIRTIRSGRASGCRASSSAMFVSGPVGTSVRRPSRARISRARKSTACSGRSAPARGGQVGAVEAALAVHVRGDRALAHERPVGAAVDRDVAAAGELEHAQGVRGRLLDRLVAADGRDADELELGRGEREQERDRVVVAGIAVEDDRGRAHAGQYRVQLGPVGREGCAPSFVAASAPGGAGPAERLVVRPLLEDPEHESRPRRRRPPRCRRRRRPAAALRARHLARRPRTARRPRRPA